jgi:hypothetical protein
VDIHHLYIGYKQAYDSINRDQLTEIMEEYEMLSELIILVKMKLENTNNKVKIQGNTSPSFDMVLGLRQGDTLSTLLFNLCMEKVTRNVTTNPGGTIFNRTRQCLLYADDVVVLGHAVKHVAETAEYVTCSITDWLDHKCIQN